MFRCCAHSPFWLAFIGAGCVGRAKQRKNDSQGALNDYNQALQINPRDASAIALRGFAYFDKGDADAALTDENAQVQLRPQSAAAYLDRGGIRIRRGELDQAETDSNKAIELDPKLAAGYRFRGFILGSKGDLSGALADYDTAVKLDAPDARGYNGRGIIKLANADLDSAFVDLQRATELALTDRARFYAQIYLWITLAEQKRIPEANRRLTDYLQNIQFDESQLWLRAIAAFLLDKTDEAAFLAAAKKGYSEVAVRGQTCEGWFCCRA